MEGRLGITVYFSILPHSFACVGTLRQREREQELGVVSPLEVAEGWWTQVNRGYWLLREGNCPNNEGVFKRLFSFTYLYLECEVINEMTFSVQTSLQRPRPLTLGIIPEQLAAVINCNCILIHCRWFLLMIDCADYNTHWVSSASVLTHTLFWLPSQGSTDSCILSSPQSEKKTPFIRCLVDHAKSTIPLLWFAGCCLVTAVISFFVSLSLPSNGCERQNNFAHQASRPRQ
jgi:hypothetical protein